MKIKQATVAFMTLTCLAGCGSSAKNSDIQNDKTIIPMTKLEKPLFQKKYTNADYYKDGKFDGQLALQAYLEMFEYYGVPFTDFMKENLWVSDFDLGDFENVGMAGVFWVNDPVNRHFGHEIYLLPGQMIPEHRHEATEAFPAKFESWMVRNGWAYNFGIGETSPNLPVLPASQKGAITVSNYEIIKVGDIRPLKELLSSHFLRAGDNGAIISEFGTYQDGNGLKFTNQKAFFRDALRD